MSARSRPYGSDVGHHSVGLTQHLTPTEGRGNLRWLRGDIAAGSCAAPDNPLPAALGEGLLRLRRTRVRIPPPPGVPRLRMCRSGRCWRCTDTSQDTAGHEKTQDSCPGVGIKFDERRLRSHRAGVFLDPVEELLTAPPPVIGGSRARARSFEELSVRGPGRRRPLEAGGAERPRRREFLSGNFCVPLCLAVTRCVPLALAVSRWIPLLTWIVVTPRLHGGRHGSRRPHDARSARPPRTARRDLRLLGSGRPLRLVPPSDPTTWLRHSPVPPGSRP